jgi:hypothetical protein
MMVRLTTSWCKWAIPAAAWFLFRQEQPWEQPRDDNLRQEMRAGLQHVGGHEMIKKIIGAVEQVSTPTWLDLRDLADVDVTSEDAVSPVERLFDDDAPTAWRAGLPGRQTIRLRFHRPVRITRIRVMFEETTTTRTQEFVLRWRRNDGDRDVDIVRQQFTFAPPGTTREREDYAVNLVDVSALELSIVPDISGGDAVATLQQFRIA